MSRKRFPRHRKSRRARNAQNGAARDYVAASVPQRVRVLSWRESFARALSTFTLAPPPPPEMPDLSWYGQGRAMRRTWRQTMGYIRAAYSEETVGHGEKR